MKKIFVLLIGCNGNVSVWKNWVGSQSKCLFLINPKHKNLSSVFCVGMGVWKGGWVDGYLYMIL